MAPRRAERRLEERSAHERFISSLKGVFRRNSEVDSTKYFNDAHAGMQEVFRKVLENGQMNSQHYEGADEILDNIREKIKLSNDHLETMNKKLIEKMGGEEAIRNNPFLSERDFRNNPILEKILKRAHTWWADATRYALIDLLKKSHESNETLENLKTKLNEFNQKVADHGDMDRMMDLGFLHTLEPDINLAETYIDDSDLATLGIRRGPQTEIQLNRLIGNLRTAYATIAGEIPETLGERAGGPERMTREDIERALYEQSGNIYQLYSKYIDLENFKKDILEQQDEQKKAYNEAQFEKEYTNALLNAGREYFALKERGRLGSLFGWLGHYLGFLNPFRWLRGKEGEEPKSHIDVFNAFRNAHQNRAGGWNTETFEKEFGKLVEKMAEAEA